MTNKSGIILETDEQGSRVYLVDKKGNETLTSEVKVDKDEQLLSCVKLDVDNLNIVRPDSDCKEPFSVHGDQAHISKLLIDGITTSSKFIENMKALHLDFEEDLKSEVSALRQEDSELKQKLEER